VIVVVLENKSFAQVARSSPYLNTLAGRCGLASNYLAITHPSLPNYIALTSGSTGGITSNCTDCRVATRSIFEQLGPGWRSYLEAMPRAGYRGAASGTYVKKHNPAAYYTRIARAYARQAVPLGTLEAGPLLGDLRRDTLRRFSFLVPDLCHDEHDCPVAVGDAWLSRWIPVILASPGYRRGGTALFITYDEGTYSDNHVYTVVVSPSTPPGTIVGTALDHYSLLRAFESLLGFRCLGHACERQATSVLESFRLR
jgi:phosphatidylinositol-3-phosphatase